MISQLRRSAFTTDYYISDVHTPCAEYKAIKWNAALRRLNICTTTNQKLAHGEKILTDFNIFEFETQAILNLYSEA